MKLKGKLTIKTNLKGKINNGFIYPDLENLEIMPSKDVQIFNHPNSYGYNNVKVNKVTSGIDANITSQNIRKGVNILGVTGNVIELNGETKNVEPKTYTQTIVPTGTGKNALTSVTVNGVTNAIDSNIQAGNIKKDVEILGVTGNVIELNGETKEVTPTTSEQIIVPTGTGKNALTSVTVNAVTNAIDSNIQAGNIKKDVEILGVTGNVIELNGETKEVTPTTSEQTILPTGTGKNALTSVTVNGVTSAIDSNIQAGNIKKDVTILGVTGTFEGSGASNVLPSNYQEVEYIEMDSSEPYHTFICTGIQLKDVSTIDLKYSFTNVVNNNPMVISCYLSPESLGSTTPFICTNGTANGNLSISPTLGKSAINTPLDYLVTNTSTSTNYIKIGGWGDSNWTAIGRYYYVRIFDKNNRIMFNGIPCYRKSDNVVGLYDLATSTFFVNASSGTYTAGPDVS